ncbi:MAG: hypothetical protein ACREAY_04455 [Nitrososphaera sp.]
MTTTTTKKEAAVKLVSKQAKTEDELAFEEYLHQCELAMENH